MASLVGKIQDIELEISRTQINKATMAHICGLRAKLAKFKRELLDPVKHGGGGGPGEGFDVRTTGDARCGFVGFPSVGKSTLLTSLTDVYSEAASYEFTTLTCVPGVKFWRGAKIQLLDLPGIIEGANDGKGRGKQVIAVARTCSCIIIVLDAMKPYARDASNSDQHARSHRAEMGCPRAAGSATNGSLRRSSRGWASASTSSRRRSP